MSGILQNAGLNMPGYAARLIIMTGRALAFGRSCAVLSQRIDVWPQSVNHRAGFTPATYRRGTPHE